MSMMSNTDALISKPKFPKERTEHGIVTLNLANTWTFPNSIIRVTQTTPGVANGWVANAVNIGNTFGLQGWNQVGPTVINVAGNTIFLSIGVGNTIPNGTVITFSKPISFSGPKANITANVYNANTYLVTSTRLNNANSILQSSLFKTSNIKQSVVAHQGWVHLKPQTGYVKSIQILNAGNQASNGYLVISSNTKYPGGAGANASYTVNANGSIISITMNANGGNYFLTPAVTAPFTGNSTNAVNATFVVTMGGRANRITTEVLAALNNPVALDGTSGGQWFPGT